jgi:serpin B
MQLAFDPQRADFGPMTSDQSLPGLFISNAYHKTFIALDELGTEAAAATAVVMELAAAMPEPEDPVELRVDRPFFYAVMDTGSRTALFLGRVTDPR